LVYLPTIKGIARKKAGYKQGENEVRMEGRKT
jgi:hypothetical protein